jgi:hypothetical protein
LRHQRDSWLLLYSTLGPTLFFSSKPVIGRVLYN